MSFSGLDPAAVTHSADRLASQATALDKIVGHVDALMRTAMHHWSGREALDFHQWWVGQHRPRLVEASAGLHTAAAGLRRQVSDQIQVSGGAGEWFAKLPAGAGGAAGHSARELLALASDSYDPEGTSITVNGHTWYQVSEDELRRLGVSRGMMMDPVTGFSATLYRDETGDYVLAFAGTDPESPADIVTDITGAAGISAQSAQAIRVATTLDRHLGDDLSFTGHSLGGRLAAVSSIATGNEATTFNAAGVSDAEFGLALAVSGRDPHLVENVAKNVLMRMPVSGFLGDGPDVYAAERRELEGRVTAYYGGADPLTLTQNATGAPNAVGQQVYVDSHGKILIEAHDPDGLAPGLPT